MKETLMAIATALPAAFGHLWLTVIIAFVVLFVMIATDKPKYLPKKKRRRTYNEHDHFIYWNLFLNKRNRD